MSTNDNVRDKVREGYGEIARAGQWSSVNADQPTTGLTINASDQEDACCAGGGCCGPTTLSAEQVALAVGYADTDLSQLPDGANLGLSCGNPNALAALNPGETVVDLGSGAGFDCFIAGPKVGPTGHVIGVDMTPDMLSKARTNLTPYRDRTQLDNVEFRLGEIEHLPIPDNTADVIISNCVINLSPDKRQVWREIARVLAPGGRVAVSDLALKQPLPAPILNDLDALVGCVAGAELIDDVHAAARDAGLTDITLTEKPEYIDAMTTWQDPLYKKIASALPANSTMSDYVVSLDITARKPS